MHTYIHTYIHTYTHTSTIFVSLGKDPKVHRQLKRPWKKDAGKFMDIMQRSIKDAGRLADGASLTDLGSKPKVNAKKAAKKDKAKRK
jgi:hypothetical protein